MTGSNLRLRSAPRRFVFLHLKSLPSHVARSLETPTASGFYPFTTPVESPCLRVALAERTASRAGMGGLHRRSFICDSWIKTPSSQSEGKAAGVFGAVHEGKRRGTLNMMNCHGYGRR